MSVRGTPHASTWARRTTRGRLRSRLARPAWSGPAWGAIGVTGLFVALTCWWISQDGAMPYNDAAIHTGMAFKLYDQLAAGEWLRPFTDAAVYPPLTPLVGALGIAFGGRTVGAPILAENLVYVPLLALACYRTGRLAYGPTAGLLAVVFALGAPLVIEQFHVFMLDAPLAALVAVTIWLVLESDRFRRTDLALVAGLVAGLGLLAKQSLPLYLPGLLLVVLVRGGGWRNWRGLALFALGALVVAAPWYAYHASRLDAFAHVAGGADTVPLLARPALLSEANATWYFYALANGLLFVPLLAFAAIGVVHAAVSTARAPRQAGVVPELLGGLLGAWLAITAIPHHDVRYTLPLIVYLAVLGGGWIVRVRPSAPRAAALVALGLAVVATTLGATFGVGSPSSELLPGNRAAPRGEGVMRLSGVTFYASPDYMVSGPREGNGVLELLRELRADGVRRVVWFEEWAPLWDVDFNSLGIMAFARVVGLTYPYGTINLADIRPHVAVLIPERSLDEARPCMRLRDGRGLWIRFGNPWRDGVRDYCPRFSPHVYGP
ncbi:MAG TPA: glycosyltransferase family 39 protein [Conexibacter sp.]